MFFLLYDELSDYDSEDYKLFSDLSSKFVWDLGELLELTDWFETFDFYGIEPEVDVDLFTSASLFVGYVF